MADIISGDDNRTTVMVMNIPPKLQPEQLLSLLAIKGFEGKFDWFYLPSAGHQKQGQKKNACYAFINFIDPLIVLDFYEKFNDLEWNKQFERCQSEKRCQLRYAEFQGLESIEKHYNGKKVSLKETTFKPLRLNAKPLSLADRESILAEFGLAP